MQKRTAVIDRIENGIATVIYDDNGEILETVLPDGFFEGQTVVVSADGGVRPVREQETPPRNNKNRLQNLFNKNK